MGGPAEVPGSIPGSRKSPFWVMSGWCFLGFLHMLGHVGGHFGDTFWSGRGHFFEIFGMSWDVSGSGLGTFLDGFGKVLEKNVRRGPEIKIFKHVREYVS